MSDLTRYAQDYRGDWCADERGKWVKADDAEALIAELEAALDEARDDHAAEARARVSALRLWSARTAKAEARIKELEARLRAADELADAVDAELALDGPYWIWEYAKPDASKIGAALTAIDEVER